MSVNSLVLASGSPRRFELLQLLDRPFTVVRPDVVEQRNAAELPTDYVKRLALDKARAGASLTSADALVLGADTIVVADNQVLEKPTSFDHFVRMMQQLSGQTHQAITAVAAVCQGIERVIVSAAKVTFKPLSSEEIADYWHSGEPREQTEWHRCVAYRRLAEIAGEYLKKGSKVYVEGRLQTRKWQGQDGVERYTTEIVINDLQMLDGRPGGGQGSQGGGYGGGQFGGQQSSQQNAPQGGQGGGFGGGQQGGQRQAPAQSFNQQGNQQGSQQPAQQPQQNQEPFVPDQDFDDDIPF